MFHFESHLLVSSLSNPMYGLLRVLTVYYWFIADNWCLPTRRRHWETAARDCIGMCHDMPEGQTPSQPLVRLILPAWDSAYVSPQTCPSIFLTSWYFFKILVLLWNQFLPLFWWQRSSVNFIVHIKLWKLYILQTVNCIWQSLLAWR